MMEYIPNLFRQKIQCNLSIMQLGITIYITKAVNIKTMNQTGD